MLIEKRDWHWADWALFGVMTCFFGLSLVYLIFQPEALVGSGSMLLVFLWMLAAYFIPLLFWRPGYINKLLFPVAVLLTSGSLEIYLVYHVKDWVGTIIFPLIIIGFLTERRTMWWNISVYLLLFPLLEHFAILGGKPPISHLISQMINWGLLFFFGFSIHRILASNFHIRRLYEENLRQYELIQEQNKALEQYSKQVEKLTLLEERNRLARELHDTVGHTFTSVIMGMDAVSYLIEAAPDKAKQKLDVLRDFTRSGLDEVRRSIHQIAPQQDDGTLMQQLSRLAYEFALHTGTQVRIQHAGCEYEIPRQAQLTLIRCLQESLTNAKRHGQAASIEINVEFQSMQVVLRIKDDGIGADHIAPGFGLMTMKERLSAIQGSLQVTSSNRGGTEIACTIPAAPLPTPTGTGNRSF